MNYKYGFNEGTGISEQLSGGKHTGVELVSIKFEDLSATNFTKVLRFTFKKDGMSFRHTELPVDTAVIARWNFKKSTYEETVARKFRELGERLKHIYTGLTGDHRINLEKEFWQEFCEQYIAMIGTRYEGKRFCIKVVYNDKGYTTFPERAISPFLVTDENQHLIKIDSQHDKVLQPYPKTTTDKAEDYQTEDALANTSESNQDDITF